MRVAEAISWATHKTELFAYLGLLVEPTGPEATRLQAWFDAAVETADAYLERDFIPLQVRWSIKGGIGVGDVFEVTCGLEGKQAYSASITALGSDTPVSIAHFLKGILEPQLSGQAVTVDGHAGSIEIRSDDLETALVCSCAYTPVGGASGIIETVHWDQLPTRVKTGVFEYVLSIREVYHRPPGLVRVKNAVVEEEYSSARAAEEAFRAAKWWWSPLKQNPLLDGA